MTFGLTPLANGADTCCDLWDTMRTPATLALAGLLAEWFADKFAMRKSDNLRVIENLEAIFVSPR
jgi:hypothetical protein